MGKFTDAAMELRNSQDKFHNCAQAIFVPFAKEKGIPEDMAYKMASGFGGGMKSGSTCGTITSGIMVLGLYGMDTPGNIRLLFQKIADNHDGMTSCRDLLRASFERGEDKKTHCDGLITEMTQALEEILMTE